MTKNGQTLSGYLSKTLRQNNTLHEWEIMSISVSNWMKDEANGLSKYLQKLEQDEASKGKAYKTKLRVQNNFAAANFIDRLYQALITEKQKTHDMLVCIKNLDKKELENRNNLFVFVKTVESLTTENELYLKLLLEKSTVKPSIEDMKGLIKSDQLFRFGINLLIKNNLTEW